MSMTDSAEKMLDDDSIAFEVVLDEHFTNQAWALETLGKFE